MIHYAFSTIEDGDMRDHENLKVMVAKAITEAKREERAKIVDIVAGYLSNERMSDFNRRLEREK